MKINSLKFTFKGNVLMDDMTLASYNINNGDTINISALTIDPINVCLKESMATRVEKILKIPIYENNTILDLKLKYLIKSLRESNISHNSPELNFVKFVYQGECLENNKTLKSYEIGDNDIIMVVALVHGGFNYFTLM